MKHTNIEIKARCNKHEVVRAYLKANHADFKGVDHQIDTYFNVPNGRLKLRQGNIENYLIHYERKNQSGPKQSQVLLYKSHPASNLKELLAKALGVLVVVDKKREIAFIDNVKFHIDTVKSVRHDKPCMAITINGGDVSANEVVPDLLELQGILRRQAGLNCEWGGEQGRVHRVYGIPSSQAGLVRLAMSMYYPQSASGKSVEWTVG